MCIINKSPLNYCNFLYDWQLKHITKKKFLERNLSNKENKEDMLENIVENLDKTIGFVFGSCLLGSVFYVAGLSLYSNYVFSKSKLIENEKQAHEHFKKVLNYYNLNNDDFELRCTISGYTEIEEIERKHVVFLNMKNNPKKVKIQHEILHYVLGNLEEWNQESFYGKIKSWGKYFFYFEPMVIKKSYDEMIE